MDKSRGRLSTRNVQTRKGDSAYHFAGYRAVIGVMPGLPDDLDCSHKRSKSVPIDDDGLHRLLTQSAIFGQCSPELHRVLVQRATVNLARRGTKVAQANAPFPFVGFVCEGLLSVTLSGEGPMRGVHRWQLYQADPGDVFCETAFLARQAPPGDIIVLSKRAVYALFPAAAIEVAITSDSELLRRFANRIAARMMAIGLRVIRSQGRPVRSRVASVLLRFAVEAEGLQPGRRGINEITQRDIAAAASCAKESAARAITALESIGALRRKHGHIVLLDRAILQRCSLESDLKVDKLPQ